jgi:putative MATE family efflux protein
MMQDRAKRLGSANIPSLLVRFATPAVVGMLAQALYNIVDRVFVGQAIGALGIAGTTLVFPFMLVLLAFSMLVGFGAAAFVSIRLGEGRKDEAERALGNAVVLLTLLSLAITAVTLVAIDPLLELLGAGPQSAPFARQYLEIIAWGALFQSISFGLNAVVRGEGNPRIAMYTMLIGALLNSVLDPLFLFQFGWGMRGAAAATVISQAVSGVWVLGYFLSGSSLLRLRSCHLRLHWPLCGKLLVLGSPMFAMQLAGSVMNIVLHNQLRFFGGGQGDLAISAIGIIHSVAHFIAMPITGLSQGAQPIIGYNHGARRHGRVRRTLMLTILCASVACVVGFVFVMLFPARVVGLFNRQDEALLELGTHAMRICLIMLPVIGFQIVGAGYFQAVGKPQHALLLGLSRQVLLLIPALYVLPLLFGLDGVWLAIPVADFCSSLLTGIWLLFELRSLNDCRDV